VRLRVQGLDERGQHPGTVVGDDDCRDGMAGLR
jgi:hypothetical protein